MHHILQPSLRTRARGVSRSYLPYGARVLDDFTLLAFTGQPVDPLTGCYHLGNGRRIYNPVLMRFQSPDSFSPFSIGGLNTYAYCGDDPVNRVDPSGASWLSKLISGVSMISSSVTLGGAVTRTARNVVNRLESQQSRSFYSPPSLRSRVGNTAFFYTGVMGVGGTALSGVEQGWIGNVLTSNGRRLGVGNAVGNITGGLFSNAEAAQAVWRGVGQPGVSAGRVAWETMYEVTGARMVVEGASYLWGGARVLGARISSAYSAAADAWRSWGAGQNPSAPPASPMEEIRQP
ncbi:MULTISPECIES: RHS repeat-associated core domain-containing protein [Pseudomonas]|uniref:RHS repeat-associated core domain-containing protein n=1 Tax=Pseudomonas TaxID=286 RepID=UPI0018E6D1B8|nr:MULTISPECIES: RHS repeat-associated core domain-containing protein [Pseudomonas]MBI6918667.1 RHS repeat-associated core domain-containing protein [Pseudomonas monteilii]MCE0937384.1 RHS repeat-associated core domain-containing protein [Pseudomonas kurunegalensis]